MEVCAEVFVPGALKMFNVRGRDETLQAMQSYLHPIHLPLFHLGKKVHKLAEVVAPVRRYTYCLVNSGNMITSRVLSRTNIRCNLRKATGGTAAGEKGWSTTTYKPGNQNMNSELPSSHYCIAYANHPNFAQQEEQTMFILCINTHIYPWEGWAYIQQFLLMNHEKQDRHYKPFHVNCHYVCSIWERDVKTSLTSSSRQLVIFIHNLHTEPINTREWFKSNSNFVILKLRSTAMERFSALLKFLFFIYECAGI